MRTAILPALVLSLAIPLCARADEGPGPGPDLPGASTCKPTYHFHSSALVEVDFEGPETRGEGSAVVGGSVKRFVYRDGSLVSGADDVRPGRPDRQPLIHAEGDYPIATARVKLVAPQSGELEHPCGGTQGMVLIGTLTSDSCACAGCTCKAHEFLVRVRGLVSGIGAAVQGGIWGITLDWDGKFLGNKFPTAFRRPLDKTFRVRIPTGTTAMTYALEIGYSINNGTKGFASLILNAEMLQQVLEVRCVK